MLIPITRDASSVVTATTCGIVNAFCAACRNCASSSAAYSRSARRTSSIASAADTGFSATDFHHVRMVPSPLNFSELMTRAPAFAEATVDRHTHERISS